MYKVLRQIEENLTELKGKECPLSLSSDLPIYTLVNSLLISSDIIYFGEVKNILEKSLGKEYIAYRLLNGLGVLHLLSLEPKIIEQFSPKDLLVLKKIVKQLSKSGTYLLVTKKLINNGNS